MKTGWYDGNRQFFVVKPLHNGHRQSLIMGACHYDTNKWVIMMGIFPCNATYNSMYKSSVWTYPTSTNKKPSIEILTIALEALGEVEQEIHNHTNGKRAFLYVDGLDERRLRIYTKVLTQKCGYKKSKAPSVCGKGMHQLYKRV